MATKDGEERVEVKYISPRLLAMFDWFMHKAPFWSKHIYEKKVTPNARKTFAQFVLKTHKDALRNGDFADIWKNHLSLTKGAATTTTDSVISKMMTPKRDVADGAGAGADGAEVAAGAGALRGLARAAAAAPSDSSQGSAASAAPSTPSSAGVGNAPISPGRRRAGGTPSPTKGARKATPSPAKGAGKATPSPAKGAGQATPSPAKGVTAATTSPSGRSQRGGK